ncbi:DsrE/DsrF/TusD sulfur relay family protein [Alicyclobacillus macrosporangiidus]|uniref:DsrE/DsrF/TusD sulfur relay family protein n=1 Tax=Alicyclobacillus macrosporangiidus TaxID=392015 RepID=UPI0009426A8B|nr:DsrE family protein [Alicyclobacillus macrosporangiidus]
MKLLFILNDSPYGAERSYNGLRHATSVAIQDGTEVRICLMADAVSCAKRGQKTPDGYYNLDKMLTVVARRSSSIACGSCLDARGITSEELHEAVHRSSMEELTEWTLWADKVIVY